MSCLRNYIGIRGCSIDTPDSEVYINELPGVSLKTIDNIADSEQINFAGVWSDVQSRSLRKFSTDVQNYLSKKYKLNSPLETINLGTGVEVSNTTAAAAKYRGLYIGMVYGSQLQAVHVQEVNIYSSAVKTGVSLVIKELADNGIWFELYATSIALTIGWNRFYIGQNFSAKKIFIGYDCTDIIAPALILQNDCCNVSCCDIEISGAITDFTTIQEGSNTFGLSATLSVRCSFEAFICNNKSLFTQSLLLVHGVELMNERIHSPRLNQYTLFGADKAKELRAELIEQYQVELGNVLDSVSFDSDCCVDCNGLVKVIDRLP